MARVVQIDQGPKIPDNATSVANDAPNKDRWPTKYNDLTYKDIFACLPGVVHLLCKKRRKLQYWIPKQAQAMMSNPMQ